MMMINILIPDDDNELLYKCIHNQISPITLSYTDTWEEMQEGTVRVVIYCES